MIVIPMAGKSSRFYSSGYKKPKFMLPLPNDSNVFFEALNSFNNYFESELFLFIIRTDDGALDFVNQECEKLGIKKYKIISLNFETRGQADTVALGINKANFSNFHEPLYIFNIDSIRKNFKKQSHDFLYEVKGYLEVFRGAGEHWSFIEPGINNLVKRTTEKIKISDLCSNGLYYFSSQKLFLETFKTLETVNDYKEFFIAPMYNILISEGHKIKYNILEKNQTLFSGTPDEYEYLFKNYTNQFNL